MAPFGHLTFVGLLVTAAGRRNRWEAKARTNSSDEDVPQRKVPPAGPALFGQPGDLCTVDERCVLLTDSYGMYRPAHLSGKAFSVEEAAVGLLQDQYALNKKVNGTVVTADNVATLVGVEPVALADGQQVSFQELETFLGSGKDLRVVWRPSPTFSGPSSHTQALVQMSNGMYDRAHEEWSWDALPTTKELISTLTDSARLNGFLTGVKDILSDLGGFFRCLQNLPEKYRMGGIAELLKKFADSPKDAATEVYEVWIKPPLSTLRELVSKDEEAATNAPFNAIIGPSEGNEKCVSQRGAGALLCDADAGNLGKRIKGGDHTDTFQIYMKGHSTVCAKRTDSSGGWGMDLWIGCHETMEGFPVIMGPSVDQKKCVYVAATNPICAPDAANKDRRLNADWADASDTFIVSVEMAEKRICVERTDKAEMWGMNLMFECHASAVTIGVATLADGSWKQYSIEKAWIRINDVVSMPNMEVGKCVVEGILNPLKGVTNDFVLQGMNFVDVEVRQFLQSVASFVARSITSIRFDGFKGVDLKDLGDIAMGAADEVCMKELKDAAAYRQMPGVNVSATMMKPLTMIAPAVATKSVEAMVKRIGNYVVHDLFAPSLRRVLNVILEVGNNLLLYVDGICGLLPEVGGIICDAFLMPLSSALVYIQEPLHAEAMKFVEKLFVTLSAQIAGWIAGKVQHLVDISTGITSDMSTKVYDFIELAIGSIPWIGPILKKEIVHNLLDAAFAGIMYFVSSTLELVLPDVGVKINACFKLRNVILGSK